MLLATTSIASCPQLTATTILSTCYLAFMQYLVTTLLSVTMGTGSIIVWNISASSFIQLLLWFFYLCYMCMSLVYDILRCCSLCLHYVTWL